jgi:radical SAM superfamily enzyme YgiQ (UPF0313 family)
LDEATIGLLRTAPAGRIQLEIGVQSTNTDTLNKIDRKNNLDRIASSVTKILEKDNIHIHLDLIAGLPGEGIESFRESYNYCFNLKPHKLQLGFLKVLKGSRLWSESAEHGLVYDDNPPYEVLATRDISYDELRTLHDVEEMTDRVFNERRFARSLEYIGKWINGFDLFLRLAQECRRAGGFQGHREDILFASVYNVGLEIVNDKELLEECLRYDYLRKRRGSVLDWMKDRQLQGIDRSKLLRELFPNNKGMHKFVHVEGFDYDMAGTRCPQMAIFNYVDGTVTWYDGLIE